MNMMLGGSLSQFGYGGKDKNPTTAGNHPAYNFHLTDCTLLVNFYDIFNFIDAIKQQ
jgi:hypothetical protein